MNLEEANQWLLGNRSTVNEIPQSPFDTWLVRVAQADAANTEQAYWVAKAHSEMIITEVKK